MGWRALGGLLVSQRLQDCATGRGMSEEESQPEHPRCLESSRDSCGCSRVLGEWPRTGVGDLRVVDRTWACSLQDLGTTGILSRRMGLIKCKDCARNPEERKEGPLLHSSLRAHGSWLWDVGEMDPRVFVDRAIRVYQWRGVESTRGTWGDS